MIFPEACLRSDLSDILKVRPLSAVILNPWLSPRINSMKDPCLVKIITGFFTVLRFAQNDRLFVVSYELSIT